MDDWEGAFDGDTPFPAPLASNCEVIFPTPQDIRIRNRQIMSTVVLSIVLASVIWFTPISFLIKFLFTVWNLVLVLPSSLFSLMIGRIEINDSRIFIQGFPTIYHRLKTVEYEVSKDEILSMEFKKKLSTRGSISFVPRIEIVLSAGRSVFIRMPQGFFGYFRKYDDLKARIKPFNHGYESI